MVGWFHPKQDKNLTSVVYPTFQSRDKIQNKSQNARMEAHNGFLPVDFPTTGGFQLFMSIPDFNGQSRWSGEIRVPEQLGLTRDRPTNCATNFLSPSRENIWKRFVI